MSKILCSRIRYIVPFMFESEASYDSLIHTIAELPEWTLENMGESELEQDLYQTILDSFTMDLDQSNIGCSFLFQNEENQNLIIDFKYTGAESDLDVSIVNIGTYLFRTGIGFLWYELKLPENMDTELLIRFQNEFKELSYARFVHLNERQTRYTFELEEKTHKGLLMGHWIADLLYKMPFTVSYFAQRKDPLDNDRKIPDKALLFNYVIFEKGTDKSAYLQEIYHLNNGYNARYAVNETFENQLVKPFKDAYFCATTHGCGYYAVPNDSNMNFYLHTKRKRVMSDYFILDILALYQAYSVLRFTNKMEQDLAAESERYMTDSSEILNKLKTLSTQINVFLVKSVYSSVSHISHHNEFYDYLMRAYRVRENIEGLTIGLESLQRLQEARERERTEKIEQEKSQEQERSDNRLNIGLGLISILALISAISDGDAAFELIVKMLHLPESMKIVFDWGMLILVFAVAFIAIKSIRLYIAQSKKK